VSSRHSRPSATPDETEQRFAHAGFVEVDAWLQSGPTAFPAPGRLTQFNHQLESREYQDPFPDQKGSEASVSGLLAMAALDMPLLPIDNGQSNLHGRRPKST